MILDQLEKIGLSEGEAKTYLAALELGETSVARIALKAGMKRTTAYEFIEDLKKKGLLTTTKQGKKTRYIAEEPKKLRIMAEERTKLIDQMLPELLSITNIIDRKPTVRYFENKEGIFDIYRETLEFRGQPIRMWMSERGLWYDDESFWHEYYIPRRLEKKILLKAILPRTQATEKFHESDRGSQRQTCLQEEKTIESDIMLYGGRFVAFISYDEMIGLVIESKKIFTTLQTIFNMEWRSLGYEDKS